MDIPLTALIFLLAGATVLALLSAFTRSAPKERRGLEGLKDLSGSPDAFVEGAGSRREALGRASREWRRFETYRSLEQTLERAGWKAALRRIGGRSSYGEMVHALAALHAQVFLLPPTLQVKTYIEHCDLVVCPFKVQHAAKAAIEAQALGRPAVLYDGDEAREYVRDGETGILVPGGDIPALARALDRLVEEDDVRIRMGRAGAAFVRQRFDRDTQMAALAKHLFMKD